jgi:hypothetical protein
MHPQSAGSLKPVAASCKEKLTVTNNRRMLGAMMAERLPTQFTVTAVEPELMRRIIQEQLELSGTKMRKVRSRSDVTKSALRKMFFGGRKRKK